MAYQYITQYNSPNFTAAADVADVFGQGPRQITGITIHHWGEPNTGLTFQSTVDFLCTPWEQRANKSQTSAHYVVEAGRVACLVDAGNAAWHAGSAYGNVHTIGIECRPEHSDADYQTVAQLIAELRATYGNLPLYPHNHWFNTQCPGDYDLNRLDSMARGIATPSSAPVAHAPAHAPVSSGATTVQHGEGQIHWIVEAGDTLSKISQYYYGDTSHVADIANYNGIHNVNALTVGQKVWVPGPMVWNIEAPDTIRSVAAYYGLDAGYLASINGLSGPDATIYIGNVLKIM